METWLHCINSWAVTWAVTLSSKRCLSSARPFPFPVDLLPRSRTCQSLHRSKDSGSCHRPTVLARKGLRRGQLDTSVGEVPLQFLCFHFPVTGL